jgi:hypothetical protein
MPDLVSILRAYATQATDAEMHASTQRIRDVLLAAAAEIEKLQQAKLKLVSNAAAEVLHERALMEQVQLQSLLSYALNRATHWPARDFA